MNARWLFLCSVLLLLFAKGAHAGGGVFQPTKDGKTLVWNNHRESADEVTWSGGRDAKGYAKGPGKLTWYKIQGKIVTGSRIASLRGPSVVTSRYSGEMVRGKFEGLVIAVDAKGNTFHGLFADGDNTGLWVPGPAPTPPIPDELHNQSPPPDAIVAARPEISPSPAVPRAKGVARVGTIVESPAEGPAQEAKAKMEKPPSPAPAPAVASIKADSAKSAAAGRPKFAAEQVRPTGVTHPAKTPNPENIHKPAAQPPMARSPAEETASEEKTENAQPDSAKVAAAAGGSTLNAQRPMPEPPAEGPSPSSPRNESLRPADQTAALHDPPTKEDPSESAIRERPSPGIDDTVRTLVAVPSPQTPERSTKVSPQPPVPLAKAESPTPSAQNVRKQVDERLEPEPPAEGPRPEEKAENARADSAKPAATAGRPALKSESVREQVAQGSIPAPAAGPRITAKEVIELANAEAHRRGYNPDAYQRLQADYTPEDETWSVSYDQMNAGGFRKHFRVSVDDKTKKASVITEASRVPEY